MEDTTQTGIVGVHHQGNHADQGTDDAHHGAEEGQQWHGLGRSIRLHTAVPPAVLLAHLCDEGLFRQGWRGEASAYLSPTDAPAMGPELTAALGSTEPALRHEQE